MSDSPPVDAHENAGPEPTDPIPPAGERPPGALTEGADPSWGQLPAPWLRPRLDYPAVVALGYRWARATRIEQVFWGVVFAACLVVLGLAGLKLSPDPSGLGTHQQLGLPPCGFIAMSGGYPCPSCGYTTTFTLAAHGRLIDAFANQPFGFVVFCLTVLAVPAAGLSFFRRVSLFGATERWPWVRIFASLLLGWIGAWLYKISYVVT